MSRDFREATEVQLSIDLCQRASAYSLAPIAPSQRRQSISILSHMVKLILPGQVVPSTPVDAGLQRFLPVEVVREQEVAAAVARGAPVEKHDFDGADPNDLIELTYDDGFTQWISVEQFLADRREEGAQRGGFTQAVRQAIRVMDFPHDPTRKEPP